MKTIKQTLIDASLALKETSHSARLDAELLLQFCLNKSRTFLFTYPEKELTALQEHTLNGYIDQRAQGKPVAYITGEKEFWSLNLKVSNNTLIPRPDTEVLVEVALEKLRCIHNPIIIELGTGSGAVAIALATERPDAIIYASDISVQALEIAQINIDAYQLKNINLLKSNWFQNYPNIQADMIISNPPYIATNCTLLEENVKNHEPELALFSKDKGYKDLLTIIKQSTYYLRHHGYVLLEHGVNQEMKLDKVFIESGFLSVENHTDLQKINRCISAKINRSDN